MPGTKVKTVPKPAVSAKDPFAAQEMAITAGE